MTCMEMERLLDLAEPNDQDREAMRRHAAECPECRMLLELRQLDRDEQVPEEAQTRWRAAVRAEKAREPARGRRGSSFWRVAAPLCAAAAVLVAAVGLRKPIQEISLTQSPKPAAVATEAPAMADTAAEPAMKAMPAAASVPAATAMPMPADEMPMLMEESAMVANDFAVPEEEVLEEDEEAPFLDDGASALDEALAAGEIERIPLLQWSAADPRKAAEIVMTALGLSPDSDALRCEEDVVQLQLNVAPEQYPALMQALADAGMDPLPEDAWAHFEEEGITQFSLIIRREEP